MSKFCTQLNIVILEIINKINKLFNLYIDAFSFRFMIGGCDCGSLMNKLTTRTLTPSPTLREEKSLVTKLAENV